MTTKIKLAITMLVVTFLGMTATAFAQGAALPEDTSLLDLARPVYDAIVHGNYWLAASLALIVVVTGIKQYAPGRLGAFVKTDAGGAIAVLLMSLGGALATALAGGGPMSWALALTAGKIALVAAGGYSLIKKLVVDPLVATTWYQEKAPAWLKAILSMVLWAFTPKAPVAIPAAERAGIEAVAAKPAEGASGIVGPGEKF